MKASMSVVDEDVGRLPARRGNGLNLSRLLLLGMQLAVRRSLTKCLALPVQLLEVVLPGWSPRRDSTCGSNDSGEELLNVNDGNESNNRVRLSDKSPDRCT